MVAKFGMTKFSLMTMLRRTEFHVDVSSVCNAWPLRAKNLEIAKINKPVNELARTLLSFKRPTLAHRTATVPIIGNFYLEVWLRQICFFSLSSKPN